MKLEKKKLWVFLGSIENPSAIFQGSRNIKIEETNKNVETVFYEVTSLEEATNVCRKYITHFNLGSGNWLGGKVIDDNNNFVARISYNGRIWDSETWEVAKEIKRKKNDWK